MSLLSILTLVADVSNVLAGVTLTISFVIIMLSLTFNIEAAAGPTATDIQIFTMKAEGFLWFLGGACMTKIFIITKNPAGAVSQTIIAFGGLFFLVSGWNAPVPIVSLRYIIPVGSVAIEGNKALAAQLDPLGLNNFPLDVAAACPFYGITCFMIATCAGFIPITGLPKDKLVSPFWGVTFFFLGAWTIGLAALWIPCIMGGFSKIEDYDIVFDSWNNKGKWIHPAQVLGALFLTAGAVIFAIMDHCSPPPPSKDEALMGDAAATA